MKSALKKENWSLLLEILSQPTAPYREGHVVTLVERTLNKASVPFFRDPIGNLVIGARSSAELLKLLRRAGGQPRDPDEPLRIFMAHMDHPGFHGTRWVNKDTLEIKWHGGSPVEYLEGYPVWLGSAQGWEDKGTIFSARLMKHKRAIDTARIKLSSPSLHSRFKNPSALFGGFSFRKPVWQEGKLIYTKAADDLVGTFAIVSLACEIFGRKTGAKPRKGLPTVPFVGILTRAEETGFIGAIGHLQLGWYAHARRPLLFVSLETSRQLPGAQIGKGPIVRLGDRFTVFSANALRVLLDVAEKTLPKKYQARVMDGGACEATAATVYGLPAVGFSIPLGNYHNQAFEGGPDCGGPMGPAPEFVHQDDVAGMLALCRAILKPKLSWANPFENRRKNFKKSFVKARKLLKSG
ncbi:MAG TPA: hypothetical protein DCS07_11750 [Bdellovibrionales bacterium]|nr:MAG: hypothetical protein A2Z97_14610 [Bdellovibrionales bacterium GWB1_52_6]OFZ04071.1 MAG: hypothetical protein A2X97_14815 [Bdellovibrionales bacterium GWA1_52_35]OFZ41236.1 MAG: hypothetical protein A2070_03915 [Bdellovibrionales bacterium GWC1_52_8]HAR43282.1 hypothetical protein [Bdellovibrionales bacterium]HCM39843.1 hypothetical protein [Bdellovibrionales bacterium]